MAFQIFYIFINVSVIAAPLISGTLGQKVGWHYGFGCAGVVMVLGLFIYLSGQRCRRSRRRRPRPQQLIGRSSPERWDRSLVIVWLLISESCSRPGSWGPSALVLVGALYSS